MKVLSHTVRFVVFCVLLSPVAGLAASMTVPKLPTTGQTGQVSGPSVSELPSIGVNGAVAGRTLSRAVGDDTSLTRGGAEAKVYRKISPSVVLIITKEAFGSGTLIKADGTILTNWHVVAGFSEVGVLFKPDTEGDKPDPKMVVMADVIKIDEIADLALLKLRELPKNLPPVVSLGDISNVSVGDDVNAIGHPTGETWTFTRGYVSQVRRGYEWNIESSGAHKADVIQTQTPINPGNSGGPLLNERGALVGVNAFKDDGEGLSFAIAVTGVRDFLDRNGDRKGARKSAPSNGCEPQITFNGRDDKNIMDIIKYDRNCDGVADLIFVQPDDKSEPTRVLVDEDEDGKPEGMILSYKQNKWFDISYWDSDGDGNFDTVGYHPDGSIKPSSFGPYIKPKSK